LRDHHAPLQRVHLPRSNLERNVSLRTEAAALPSAFFVSDHSDLVEGPVPHRQQERKPFADSTLNPNFLRLINLQAGMSTQEQIAKNKCRAGYSKTEPKNST